MSPTKLLIISICTYTIFVLHTSLTRDLAIAGIAPHLVLAGLAVMTTRVERVQAVWLAAAWGLLADCLAEGRLGSSMVCFTIFAVFVQPASHPGRTGFAWKLGALSIPVGWGLLLADQLWRGLGRELKIDIGALAIQAAGTSIYTGLIIAGAAFALQILSPVSTESEISSTRTVSNQWRMLTG
jgi:rod shape-determining protein MreD